MTVLALSPLHPLPIATTYAVVPDWSWRLSSASPPATCPADGQLRPPSEVSWMEPSAQRTCALVAAVQARSSTLTVPHGASVRPAGARTRAGSLASRTQASDTETGTDQVTPAEVVVRTPISHCSSAPTTKALLASFGSTREIWGYGAGRSRQVRPPSTVTATAPPPVTHEPTVTRHATSASTAVTLVLNGTTDGTTVRWTDVVDGPRAGTVGTPSFVAATGGRDVGSVAGAPEASRLPGNRSTAPSRSTSTSRSSTRPTLASAVLRCHIVHSMTIVDPRRPDCAEYLPRPTAQRVESARTPFPPTATIRVRRARQAVGRPQRGVVRIGLNGKWMSQPMKPTPVSAAGALLGPLPTLGDHQPARRLRGAAVGKAQLGELEQVPRTAR